MRKAVQTYVPVSAAITLRPDGRWDLVALVTLEGDRVGEVRMILENAAIDVTVVGYEPVSPELGGLCVPVGGIFAADYRVAIRSNLVADDRGAKLRTKLFDDTVTTP